MQASPLIIKLNKTAKSRQKAITQTNGKSVSYSDLHSKSDMLALGLLESGFMKGDRVLLLVRPGVDAVVCVLATLKAGGCIVIADPGTGNELFRERIKEASPSWTFIDPTLNRLRKNNKLLSLLRRIDKSIPDLQGIDLPRPILCSNRTKHKSLTMASLLRHGKASELPGLKANQEAMIVFTSGTTNKPKGVVHTHETLAASLKNVEGLIPIKNPRLYTTQPYFLLLGIGVAAEVIISSRPFSPKRFMRDSKKYKPNLIFGPPGEFLPVISYCQSQKKQFPISYKQVLFGSAPITQPFLKKFYQIADSKLESQCLYGMTEAIPIATISGKDKLNWKGSGDVLGEATGDIRLKIHKDGELSVSGLHIMPHYLNQQPTEYIKTGDVVEKDEGGLLVLKGRKKDMILRRSYNIYPSLYEPTIGKIPGVRDAALIGLYDEKISDEKVILVIEPEDNTNLSRNEIELQLKHGEYSIDTNAMPDNVIFMTLPRAGRQLKIDKHALKNTLSL